MKTGRRLTRRHHRPLPSLKWLMVIAFFALVGLAIIWLRAAQPASSVAVSHGVLSGNAMLNPDPTATGGTAVVFGRSNSPSGQPLPIGNLPGWQQVFTDDFATTVPLGSFPAAVANKWWDYPDGWQDTSKNGQYTPSKVVSVHDGVMDLNLHTENGVHMVAAPVPLLPGRSAGENGVLYGRYAVRFRADITPGYKTAWLLWPDSETWPRDGEIDFPEANLYNGDTISAFMHRQNGTSGGDQDAYGSRVVEAGSGWHTVVTEWSAGKCSFYLDGILLGTSTSRVPNTSMHFVMQTETNLSGDPIPSNVSGHILIDWVAIYRPQ